MPTQKVGLALDLGGLSALKTVAQQRNVTLKGVKAGAKLIQQAAQSLAPRASGALRQSLGIKSKKGTRGKTAAFAVIGARAKVQKLVRRGKGRKRVLAVPAKYAHLVEKGTAPHGGHPGAKAHPFLMPAWRATKGRAVRTAAEVIGAEIQRLIAKESAKLGRA